VGVDVSCNLGNQYNRYPRYITSYNPQTYLLGLYFEGYISSMFFISELILFILWLVVYLIIFIVNISWNSKLVTCFSEPKRREERLKNERKTCAILVP